MVKINFKLKSSPETLMTGVESPIDIVIENNMGFSRKGFVKLKIGEFEQRYGPYTIRAFEKRTLSLPVNIPLGAAKGTRDILVDWVY